MASSRLRPFVFFDLPLELRLKIYTEVFVGSEIRLKLAHHGSRTVIAERAPPKYVRFLRTSSQTYEESLPILASSSRLKLWLSAQGSPETEAVNFQFNFQHLLTSPATGVFLRSTLPLIQAMDLVISKWLLNGQLEGLEALKNLKEIHSNTTYLTPTFKTRQITGWSPGGIDEEFLQDPAWESKILTAFRTCLDLEFLMLKKIINATAGSIRICQSLQFLICLPGSSTLLVSLAMIETLLP